ncbi:MAG TPA: (2Fe-2S)-binding protein [Gammaproteobacteria bacterium]|nr:(2Fe-2S)-binding protein [Gammaproteobacteria bacterium]
MYICICNGHRDSDIRAKAAEGLRCAREIYRHLGKPARCGRCLDLAARVVDEVHESLAGAQSPAGELCS